MSKIRISAMVDRERLARAKQLTGSDNLSEVFDRGLAALIEDELERAHTDGYARASQGPDTVEAVDAAVWSDLPWDEH